MKKAHTQSPAIPQRAPSQLILEILGIQIETFLHLNHMLHHKAGAPPEQLSKQEEGKNHIYSFLHLWLHPCPLMSEAEQSSVHQHTGKPFSTQ